MQRKAAVFGSTGLIGSNLVQLLDDNKNYSEVFAYLRKLELSNSFNKVKFVEFNKDFTIGEGVDDVYICLGTTMKKVGSKEAFKAVDMDLVVDVASKAYDAGVKRLLVVSSIGANPNSSNFYLQTKGEMEEKVKSFNFELVAVVRPSMLLGERKEFRLAESIGIWFFRIFKFIFVGPFRRYRGIEALDVAKAMIQLALTSNGKIIVESEVLKQIADVYQ
ncbi:NAD(P)H-binding protein [Tenuifilum thalassicum]|uniref:NAD-dependent epimerase/dehydratase family protein n=1 Tax=Tenuifilum thalassicum TaxID=2590900 RepID=A0A7D4AXG5_9BACT|nr:NAD(P)H-binding protein [Tenuifilum thalassicum]QKG80134.1 NAD-dependent epimerase/dehydratase family protein [Tenuifilum thalassicum]